MALKIRLQRRGRTDTKFYRIVVAEEHSKRNGRPKAYIGIYNPETKPHTLTVDKKSLEHWLAVGARPTDSLRKLLSL